MRILQMHANVLRREPGTRADCSLHAVQKVLQEAQARVDALTADLATTKAAQKKLLDSSDITSKADKKALKVHSRQQLHKGSLCDANMQDYACRHSICAFHPMAAILCDVCSCQQIRCHRRSQ